MRPRPPDPRPGHWSDQARHVRPTGRTPQPTRRRIGELRAVLSRLQDNAAVTFRCPLKDQELRFYRVQSLSKHVVQIELNQYPETPLVLPSW